MDTIIKADIFFFITAIAVVIITIALSIVGYYIVLVMRDAKYISGKLRHATDELEGDFETLRQEVSQEGHKAKYLLDFFLSKFKGKHKKEDK